MNERYLEMYMDWLGTNINTQRQISEHDIKFNPEARKQAAELLFGEGKIHAELGKLKRSFPHMAATLDCIQEAEPYLDASDIAQISFMVASSVLTFPKLDGNREEIRARNNEAYKGNELLLQAELKLVAELVRKDNLYNRSVTLLRAVKTGIVARLSMQLRGNSY